MTTLPPCLNLGMVRLKSGDDEFSGRVSIYYYSVSKEWWPADFVGVYKQQGFTYRGRWDEGEDFEKLKSMFMSDPRMPETASELVKKVTGNA